MRRIVRWIKKKRLLRKFAKRNERANALERRDAPANAVRVLQQMENSLSSIIREMEEIGRNFKSTTSQDMTPALTIRNVVPTGLTVYVCNACKAVHAQRVNSCFRCGVSGGFSEEFLR